MRIVVLGAGICGLAAGTMLARDGHEVTLVERDRAPVPDSIEAAWEAWARAGVTQFRQAHYLQPRGRAVLEEELPDVAAALAAAGALRFDVLSVMPPTIDDRAARPGDERFTTLIARRPILEYVLGRAAESQAGLDVRRGVGVTGLVSQTYGGVPHICGVDLDDGDRLAADLVVDAMGRRSPMAAWVSEIAGRAVYEESEDSGFLYYTRFFRSRGAGVPAYRSAPVTALGTFSILVVPGDNETWSVTLYASAGDRPMKRVRDLARWKAVVAACPAHAHWLDGEPLTEILPLGGVVDRIRRLVVGGRPLVSGVVLLADAWACTNPSSGRGMALGWVHAALLRDLAREGAAEPRQFALDWDALTEHRLTPWYRDTVAEDRARLREIDALRNGATLDGGVAAAGAPSASDLRAAAAGALPAAILHDPDLFRAFIEIRSCVTTRDEVLARPGLAERIVAVAAEHERRPPPGPDRDQLLALLG